MILWVICYGESDDRIGSHIKCTLGTFIDVAEPSTENFFYMGFLHTMPFYMRYKHYYIVNQTFDSFPSVKKCARKFFKMFP